MRFRNIWYRELPPRTVEGGTDGHPLSTEATMAKRRQIAASIRQDASEMNNSRQSGSAIVTAHGTLDMKPIQPTLQRVQEMAGTTCKASKIFLTTRSAPKRTKRAASAAP